MQVSGATSSHHCKSLALKAIGGIKKKPGSVLVTAGQNAELMAGVLRGDMFKPCQIPIDQSNECF